MFIYKKRLRYNQERAYERFIHPSIKTTLESDEFWKELRLTLTVTLRTNLAKQNYNALLLLGFVFDRQQTLLNSICR